MAIWHKRDTRLEKRKQRKLRRASRKRDRAEQAEKNGRDRRADRLERRADRVEDRAEANLFWDHAVIEQGSDRATESELTELKEAIELSRTRAASVDDHLAEMQGMSSDDAMTLWNDGPIGDVFGQDPEPSDVRKLVRRMGVVTNALRRENMYIVLKDRGKAYGSAAPSQLNRPLSDNVRFRLDLGVHADHHPDRADRVDEIANTIVHEITHTLDVLTDHAGDDTLRKALRDPDSFAEFFEKV